VALGITLAAGSSVVEAVLLRAVIDIGRDLGLVQQRLQAIGIVLAFGGAVLLVDIRVADATGDVVADGQVGELQVQSPANCVGYWDDPRATAAAFDHGWLRTGDLVRRDADGFFWFEGRAKQIIIRGGSNISPQEVEEALYHHPAVLEAGVIGMPDPVHGEKVIAYVALREGLTASEQELRDLVRSRIADYKTPERILFLPTLPKGLTGKVQRRALKELALMFPEMGLAVGS
jgi:long-chain acyl-CoA synthetase